MSNDVVAPVAAVGAGAGVGAVCIAQSGFTAAGMVGGGSGIGAAAGPVGMVAGAVTGLAVYGACRAAGDMIDKAQWYAAENAAIGRYYDDLNRQRDAAPETGPSLFHCTECLMPLWPKTVDNWPGRVWEDQSGSENCPSGQFHNSNPNVWGAL